MTPQGLFPMPGSLSTAELGAAVLAASVVWLAQRPVLGTGPHGLRSIAAWAWSAAVAVILWSLGLLFIEATARRAGLPLPQDYAPVPLALAWLSTLAAARVAACLAGPAARLQGAPRRPPAQAALPALLPMPALLAGCLANLLMLRAGLGMPSVPIDWWPALPGWPASAASLCAQLTAPPLATVLLAACALARRLERLEARARSELQSAADAHPLTRLPNRRRFEAEMQAAAMKADRHRQRIAVLCINVDGLKTINESFGPAAGDALLCGMAQRLLRLAGPQDRVAHASGDEFLMLLAGNPDRDTAARAAAQVISRLSDALMLGARDIATSCSVGVAMYPDDGGMSVLVTHAGAAVRCAKRNGRASYCFFEQQMVEGSRDQVDLLHDLRRAIERRQLELFYQPKIHAQGGHVTGAEALLRWRHPVRGIVSPLAFVPMAERAGLIGALGDWVIEEACRQMQAWQAEGHGIKVSINLSVHQLRQPDLVQRICGALQRHGIAPGMLSCEITESAAMEDTGTTLALVRALAAAGVKLSVDDFGTGYSSLGYLRKLPVSELKIDRSFVLDLETSADACAIVDAVIRLAHALGLTVVAEGVETEAQRRILDRLGCDELQGYLYAKPMTARVLATWAVDTQPEDAVQRPGVAPRAARQPGTAVAFK